MTTVSSWGRVSLKPVAALESHEWRAFYRYFRDRELADWNGTKPIRLPEWLFQRIMLDEERAGERHGFGILNEEGTFIGSVELYDLHPAPPGPSHQATLGVMIGERDLWGQGYGREAVGAVLRWAFEVRMPPLLSVRLTTFAHNRRAQRAFAAAGFREVGRDVRRDHTDVLMRVTREEWRSANPGS